MTVAEIADALGYSCATNFTRAFRRWTGLAPTAWLGQRPGAPAPS
jgi:AraC-like DNA-binding protein